MHGTLFEGGTDLDRHRLSRGVDGKQIRTTKYPVCEPLRLQKQAAEMGAGGPAELVPGDLEFIHATDLAPTASTSGLQCLLDGLSFLHGGLGERGHP